jgi:lysyl-tRNA synthetase class 2
MTQVEKEHPERLAKLKTLTDANEKPWGGRLAERILVSEALCKFPKLEPGTLPPHDVRFGHVVLAGRVMLRGDFGNLMFLKLRDDSGRIQVGLSKKVLTGERFNLIRKNMDLGDIISCSGELGFTQKGEPTLWADAVSFQSKSLRPLPEKFHGLEDRELRARHRYVDLIGNESSQNVFRLRSRMVSLLRRKLDDRGFLEVETPTLQAIPGGAAARPFLTHHNALDMKLYLRIATEIHLKKLLVGGFERVYEIGKIFRNEGVDTRHNPEFTSIELYQAFADLRDMMALTETVVSELAQELTGKTTSVFRGREIQLKAPWPRLDYLELLRTHAGADPADETALNRALAAKGINGAALSRVDRLDAAFGEYVEPNLWDACFVINQPLEMSPLCRAHPEQPHLADRFEAFAGCMELANAYSELNDPLEQRRRLEEQAAAEKVAGAAVGGIANAVAEGKIDEDFLLALEYGMPPAGGLGVGIDRLAMILGGVDSIRDAILFPLLRPERAEEAPAPAPAPAQP